MQYTMGHIALTRPPPHACVHEAPARTDTSAAVLGTPEGACLRAKRARDKISAATLRNVDCACLQSATASSWDDTDEDEKQEQEPAAPKDRPTVKTRQLSCWLNFIGARPPRW